MQWPLRDKFLDALGPGLRNRILGKLDPDPDPHYNYKLNPGLDLHESQNSKMEPIFVSLFAESIKNVVFLHWSHRATSTVEP
jgi:hypothetical protein